MLEAPQPDFSTDFDSLKAVPTAHAVSKDNLPASS